MRDRVTVEDNHKPFRNGDKCELERAQRNINTGCGFATDPFDLANYANLKGKMWRDIEKDKWVNNVKNETAPTNQFFYKKPA